MIRKENLGLKNYGQDKKKSGSKWKLAGDRHNGLRNKMQKREIEEKEI